MKGIDWGLKLDKLTACESWSSFEDVACQTWDGRKHTKKQNKKEKTIYQ